MTPIHPVDPAIIQVGIATAKRKIEQHYSDKFTYALPAWAMLTADPEIIAVVQIHGQAGIQLTKQRVDFAVDFNDASSITYYADYLQGHMNRQLPLVGYIMFYKHILIIQPDPNYQTTLTDFERTELEQYNQQNTDPDFSLIILTKDLEHVDSTMQLTS